MTKACFCACHTTGPKSPSCSDCESRHYRYRYEITAASKNAPVQVGAVIVESRYMGLGHCWSIFNMKSGKITSTFAGKYIGQREQAEQ